MKLVWGLLLACGIAWMCGCAVSPGAASAGASTPACNNLQAMFPATATADHNATAPGNSVQFDVGYTAQNGCAAPEVVYLPTMTSSDTVNISLPSQGIATCIGTTTVPAILTDTRSKATAQLTCK